MAIPAACGSSVLRKCPRGYSGAAMEKQFNLKLPKVIG